jgi:Zn-finger nucleic acid-binding protein
MNLCEKLTHDFEKSKFTRIPIRDRSKMRKHLAMCHKCRNYIVDSKVLDQLLQKHSENYKNRYRFTVEEKQRIKRRIEN